MNEVDKLLEMQEAKQPVEPTAEKPSIVLMVNGEEITDPMEIVSFVNENMSSQEDEPKEEDMSDPSFDSYLAGKSPSKSWE